MAITFVPRRGAILLCNFDLAFVPPEMNKERQAIVVSRYEMNHRHARAPGLCSIVPASATRPTSPGREDVFIPAGRYWSLPKDSWIKCRMLSTVSHDRFNLMLRRGRRHPTEFLAVEDMERIEDAMRFVLDIP